MNTPPVPPCWYVASCGQYESPTGYVMLLTVTPLVGDPDAGVCASQYMTRRFPSTFDAFDRFGSTMVRQSPGCRSLSRAIAQPSEAVCRDPSRMSGLPSLQQVVLRHAT